MKIFSCQYCRFECESNQTQRELLDEAAKNYPDIPKDELVEARLCEDCLKEFVTWCEFNKKAKDDKQGK